MQTPLGHSRGKEQKKWQNETMGLKFAKLVVFRDSRHDSKKKKSSRANL
jgi:hypothetical protein